MEIVGKYNRAVIHGALVDLETQKQVRDLLEARFTAGSRIVIMPDCHVGKGCVIGTTMTLTDQVVPNLVGVDIGCGVLAVKLPEQALALEPKASGVALHDFDAYVKKQIPMGFSVYPKSRYDFERLEELRCLQSPLNPHGIKRAKLDYFRKSLGTLGGGNHFIECDVCGEETWLVIHCGSRNLGVQVADYYQKLAQRQASQRENPLSKPQQTPALNREDLATLKGEDLENYLFDMKICQEYAERNRFLIAKTIYCGFWPETDFLAAEKVESIHNYIDLEYGILRKGAISAQAGERVVIPLNMRDGIIIGRGRGREDWNYSAPHGAGRVLSRRAAKEKISLQDYQSSMEGIFSSTINEKTKDEAAMVYKPSEMIIQEIEENVEIEKHGRVVYNCKG